MTISNVYDENEAEKLGFFEDEEDEQKPAPSIYDLWFEQEDK